MSYSGDWHGSGQLPARAVEQGLLSRYGSVDPAEGGGSARHQLALGFKAQPSEGSEFKAMAYLASYTFNLFSDFTLFLRDPVNGDEIEQIDRRTFYGAQLSYRVAEESSAAGASTPASAPTFAATTSTKSCGTPSTDGS